MLAAMSSMSTECDSRGEKWLSGSRKDSDLRKSSILSAWARSLVSLKNPPNAIRQADKLIQGHVY